MNSSIKNIFLLVTLSLAIISCGETSKNSNQNSDKKTIQMPGKKHANVETDNYGKEVFLKGAADIRRVPSLMEGVEEKQIKVIGEINKVCQAEGCWIDIGLGNGETMHVTFKDESFVVPKDIAGKTAVMDGIITKEIIPVALLKKIAKSEGKSQEEIDKIVSPKTEFTYEVTGVNIQ